MTATHVLFLAACASGPARDTGTQADLPAVEDLPEQEAPPDPFRTFFGDHEIRTADDWARLRAPELERLFQHYLYGLRPVPLSAPPTAVVRATHPDALGGLATLLEVEARFPELPQAAPAIAILLILPAQTHTTSTPVPILLGLNKCGNHSVVTDERVTLAETWAQDDCPAGRGGRADFWSLEEALSAGLGVATVHQSAFVPDDPDRLSEGLGPWLDAESGVGLPRESPVAETAIAVAQEQLVDRDDIAEEEVDDALGEVHPHLVEQQRPHPGLRETLATGRIGGLSGKAYGGRWRRFVGLDTSGLIVEYLHTPASSSEGRRCLKPHP